MAGDFDLTGRVAIVTGGNGGIGLGMAKALARAGCAVSIWGRNAEKNRAALAELRECGARVEARTSDVTDRAAIEDAFAGTLQAFGRVDGCFANAGIGSSARQAFVDRSEDEWRRMFATNLDGVLHRFPGGAPAHDQACRGRRPLRPGRGDVEPRVVVRDAARRALRRDQGGAQRACSHARGRARALRRHRQRDFAGLDRDRHDDRHQGQREVRRSHHAADSVAALRKSSRISAGSPSIL